MRRGSRWKELHFGYQGMLDFHSATQNYRQDGVEFYFEWGVGVVITNCSWFDLRALCRIVGIRCPEALTVPKEMLAEARRHRERHG
jgi:hypothetical protein